MTNYQPNAPQKKGGISCAVLLTLLSAVVVVFVVPSVIFFNQFLRESKQQRIIHFMIDDYSKSARESKINLAQEHCKASSLQYIKGDTLLQIAFANRPEVVINQVLDSIAPGIPLINCKEAYTPSNKVGDAKGTSLTDVMKYVQILVRNVRAKNLQQPIIVTITIQHAELDLEGKSQQETIESFDNLQDIVEDITSDKKVFISIIGPIGDLQKRLEEYIGNLPRVDICPRIGIKQCVEKAFELTRRGQ